MTQETAAGFFDPDNDILIYSASGLPDGLGIDANGDAIVGTLSHTSASAHTVRVTARDPYGAAVTQAFAWNVTNVNRPPTSNAPLPDREDAEGDAIALETTAYFDDPDADDTLVFAATGLPPGLAVAAGNGAISGRLTYTSAGSYAVRITVRDQSDAVATQSFQWNVTETPRGDALLSDGFEFP